jgi:hypothetical protein
MAATDEVPEWVLTGLVTLSRLPSWWSNRDVNVFYAGYRFPREIVVKVFLRTAVLLLAVLIPYG